MAVPDWIEKIGRKVFESPFAGDGMTETPELAEIRLVLLDAVRAKCQRVSGRRVFAYNTVTVTVRGVHQSEEGVWRSPFLHQMLQRELESGLTKLGVRFPEDLSVDVHGTTEFPTPPKQWVSVEVEMRMRPPVTAPRYSARLVVIQGTANVADMPIKKMRTNIGRTVDVHRMNGPSRRNDLAFSDDSPINRTVSREHAHIIYSKTRGEYRLFNDRIYTEGNCGLWILRDGLSQAVHRDGRGVRLLPKDEIHFGNAVVRFLEK
jgi:hypothetical protein